MDHHSGTTLTHPLQAAAVSIGAAVRAAADSDPTYLPVPDKKALLVELTRLADQVQTLALNVLAASRDVAEADGFRDTAQWLAHHTSHDRSDSARDTRLAGDLATNYEHLRQGCRFGHVNLAQAAVITRALNKLNDTNASTDVRLKAERILVAEAARHAPRQLARLGDRILELVDPDTYDDHERQLLEAQLRDAEAATRLAMRRRGDGATDLTARIPDHIATRLKTLLDAHTSPRHDAATMGACVDPETGRRLPNDRVLGQAFCSLIEAIDPNTQPQHGRAPTTVVVTIGYDQLSNGTGCGTMSDGTRIPAEEVRRLACQAAILPAVLGGDSQVLDLGRTKRLFSSAQRTALSLRHQACQAEGCDIPATWCEAHHRQPWSTGGSTNLDDGELLCSFHHHRVHDHRFRVRRTPTGTISFYRKS